METMVKVEHLYKEFGPETKVLKDINLTVNKMKLWQFLDHQELENPHYFAA